MLACHPLPVPARRPTCQARSIPVNSLTSSSGKFLYVLNYKSTGTTTNSNSTISAFTINSQGQLAPLSDSTNNPYAVGSGPLCIVQDPSNQYIYITDYNDSTVTGQAARPESRISLRPWPRHRLPDFHEAKLHGRQREPLVARTGTISAPDTAAHSSRRPNIPETRKSMKGTSMGRGFKALAVSLAAGLGMTACSRDYTVGYLYVTNAKAIPGVITAYAIDYQSGALQQLSDSPIPSGGNTPVTLVASPGGKNLFVLNQGTSTVAPFAINSDGTLTAGKAVSVSSNSSATPTALAIDPAGKFLYVAFKYLTGTSGPGRPGDLPGRG